MQLSSSAFGDGGTIPEKYTCQGEDISPPLTIRGVPDGAQSLAIVVEDPDAPTGDFVHWLLWNIDPSVTEIPEGEDPDGAIEGVGDGGSAGWTGPCPPNGEHRYVFRLYALDSAPVLPWGSEKRAFRSAIRGHALAEATFTARFSKKEERAVHE